MLYELDWQHQYSEQCAPNFDANSTVPRHRWYEFKEGYSASLVHQAIDEAKHNSSQPLRVLDPFSGSGTTALAAAQRACFATALEVNPFMNFVGQTKCFVTTQSEKQLLDQLRAVLADKPIEVDSPLEGYSTFGPRPDLDKWLFNRSVLRGFAALRHAIDKHVTDRQPFLLALFGATMECCNARRDGKCLRYRRGWKSMGLSSLELRIRFEQRVLEIIRDLVGCPIQDGTTEFVNNDCRVALSGLPQRSYDLVLFSPPYLNSFDYSDVYRPELFLGEFVSNNDELRDIRARTVRSHIQYNWKHYDSPGLASVRRLTDDLREKTEILWDKRIPAMVDSYFADMSSVLSNSHRVARPGAAMWIVVSTSAYAGTEIPVDLLLAELATKAGWRLEGVHVLRHLRASSQHVLRNGHESESIRLRESLIRCTR